MSRLCSFAARLRAILVPKSLVGQLVFTFSAAFLALLLFSSFFADHTRQYFFLRNFMADRARRMTDSVLLLEAARKDERAGLLQRLHYRGLRGILLPGQPELPAPPSDFRDQASRLLRTYINLQLEETRNPPRARLRREGELDTMPDGPALATVHELKMPTALESMKASLYRTLRMKPPRNGTACLLTAAMPLEDGTWVLFEDEIPHLPSVPSFPISGIILVELFFVAISILAFWLIARPLRRLADAADKLGRDLPGTPPLEECGPREVREATRAFNRMQRRIRDFIADRESTLAAVSHDLRTPLTRMRLRVESLDEEARLPLQKDMNELQRLMDTTIDLARGSSSEEQAPLDMAALLESLEEDRQDMGQNVRIVDPAKLENLAPLRARPLSVKRCLDNVLDNAVRYGGADGSPARVEMDVEDRPDRLTVIIRDHGPGIPEEQQEKVFQPFYRLEPSRNRNTGGNALGLAIVRTMARQHGGDVTLENAPDGGLVVRVSFRRNT